MPADAPRVHDGAMIQQVALIGFGEAAMAFAAPWREAGVAMRAYDIKTDQPATAGPKKDDYARHGVTGWVHATSTSPCEYGFGCGFVLVTFARTYSSCPVSVYVGFRSSEVATTLPMSAE